MCHIVPYIAELDTRLMAPSANLTTQIGTNLILLFFTSYKKSFMSHLKENLKIHFKAQISL